MLATSETLTNIANRRDWTMLILLWFGERAAGAYDEILGAIRVGRVQRTPQASAPLLSLGAAEHAERRTTLEL
jgi:hypothetical protein